MKYLYTVSLIIFIGCAIINLIKGNALNYDYLILAFLMAILRELEGE